MMSLKVAVKACIGLGLLSLFAVLASHLALTDIWHGEGNTTLEWPIVQVSFVVIAAFQVSALITFWRVLFSQDDRRPEGG